METKIIINVPVCVQKKNILSENYKYDLSIIKITQNFMVKNIKNIEKEENIIDISKENNFIENLPEINNQLKNSIFVPNKPTIYAPSNRGNRLYLLGLINFCLTNGQDNNIWLEKKLD